ncbi:hypothetical protein [Aquicella lusitana]|uniref:MORN repeat protein n=1 Tax=Aquicella lusitana TaxID=254246 RepID=A0A370G9B0_9COXI|nr:hypothetical protein [Aquicella lusitana]RDI39054.1 hypothetical protein C8D86_12910 [Aquicella lusitana]VVC73661.1 hypothetical protein AQULUS_14080 [Aquicella lusitana]
MKKLISRSLGALVLVSCTAFAAEGVWEGEFYGIMPKNKNVTEDYCKSHVLDKYETSATQVDKEVTAKNGVKAKDLGYSTKEQGGVYFFNGTAMFSGEEDGKSWQEKVHYFGQSLMKEGGMEQGVWYTKDCKGFYKVGPED